jgi:ABC-type amino acid transport substrate-binding protein
MRRIYTFLCLLIALAACSSGGQGRLGTFRIGIDPTWAPLNFDTQQPYVNGYTEDLLLEIAQYNGVAFEKISAGFDTLLDGLGKGQYDAILTSMPPFEFNTARYDFSQNFLETGFVLITSQDSKYAKVKELSNRLVGVISNSPAVLVLEKYPTIIIRSYSSFPDALNAVMDGEIDAAVLDRLPASAYVRDLYNGKLKIVGAPLTSSGLHAVAKKDSGHFIDSFNKAIGKMKKKGVLDTLEKKWQLQ